MRFPPRRDKSNEGFKSLSIRDLLDAREAYHVHLTNLPNVVGTAVGLYRIRDGEENAKHADKEAKYGAYGKPRVLNETVVQSWSWPCVLVFVDRWLPIEELRKHPEHTVPRFLYLPDGRVIPTCVIFAPRAQGDERKIDKLSFSSHLLGGGYPVFTRHQGVEQIGSVGCLVTDGESTYALTNRHVTGHSKKSVFTLLHGEAERVGVSDEKQLGKLPFEKVYRGWPGSRAYVNVDAGLIRVTDVNAWTSQVFGIGEIGELVDLHPDTVSLAMIGVPVRAFGGASGPIEGEIQGLFYRYRSVGGVDFIADLLIGPRPEGKVLTRPGDSGTVWFYDPPSGRREAEKAASRPKGPSVKKSRPLRKDASVAVDSREPAPEVGRASSSPDDSEIHMEPDRGLRARKLQPLALQWGGERLDGGDGTQVQFALATFLTTVCRELDVELVRQWNEGHSEYWGKIGHFKIGAKACELVTSNKLSAFMNANARNVGFGDEDLGKGKEFRVGRDQFVPLADVPDYVWIAAAHGGAGSSGGGKNGRVHEGAQHFADMDQKGRGAFHKDTLLSLCKNEKNISADVWKDFYEAFDEDERPEEGVLPFRVWQLYAAMVGALKDTKLSKKDKLAHFLTAAGTLAHYVGDACQPLHVSHLHHGRGPEGGKKSPDWEKFRKSPEYKIHAIYEQGMFEVHAVEMLDLINTAADGVEVKATVKGGYQAAVATVALMRKCHSDLPPEKIIDADDPAENAPTRGRILFRAVGKKTATLVAQGCGLLATLWESAWKEGGGDATFKMEDLKRVKEEVLTSLVRNRNFLPALTLGELVEQGYVVEGATRAPRRAVRTNGNGSARRRTNGHARRERRAEA